MNSNILKQFSLISYPCFIISRGISRVKPHRFTGVLPQKVRAPKTEWYKKAEKEFIDERKSIPNGYIRGFSGEDLAMLTPQMRAMLHLRMSNNKELVKFRERALVKKFRLHPFDRSSLGVSIAKVTEKILNLRRHLIENPKDDPRKVTMMVWLGRRTRMLRSLYNKNFPFYQTLCKELRIKCVRFSVPNSIHQSKQYNNIALDADRCKFLIRQKLWRGRYRPRPIKLAKTNQVVRYTRHPMEKPPVDFGLPKETKQKISRSFPYGVKEERVRGEYIIPDPTIPGFGYTRVPVFF